MTRLALIAAPGCEAAIELLAPTALYNPTRKRLSSAAPQAASLEELLQAAPDICGVLTPYANLARDVQTCLERGVDVLSAGPVNLTAKEMQAGGHLLSDDPQRHSLFEGNLAQASQDAAFGEPVYLRQVMGGGDNLWTAWWAAWQGLQRARRLLAAPLHSLHVAAHRQQRQFHLALTARMANHANAQVAVAPFGPPLHPDVHLLGTGGQLSALSPGNGPAFIGPAGVAYTAPQGFPPEADWLAAGLAQLERPAPLSNSAALLDRRLLSAIRAALRQQRPVPVSLPRGLD